MPTICRVWRPIVSGIYYKMWSGKWKTYALYQLHIPEEEAIKFGQNELLPISPKTSSKISIFWNYLAICPYFETRFFKKLSFNEKLDLMKNELLAKCFMELEFHVFFFFFFLSFLPIIWFSKNQVFHWNSIFRKSSLKQGYMAK